ncbi:MAG: glutathione S-transferase family protein [Rhodospirillaceae bacterium]|nr:glutathione S-transferase family protein [Rhodospirillaceae bacterium]
MTGMTLYIGNKNYSSWSLRPWLALRHAGAAFEEVVIPLDQPGTKAAIRRHSPNGRVPCLVHGDRVVWESLAVCEYAAEILPDARLWPRDPGLRAYARAIATEMHGGFLALRRALPMDIRSRHALADRLSYCQEDFERVTAIWREARQRFGGRGAHGPGPFLLGGFCLADAMYAPVTTRFVTYGMPLDDVCAAYVDAVLALPAMREWTEAARAEPWVIDYPAPGPAT